MILKINGVNIAESPKEFSVTPMDLDDGSTTVRTADGILHRDRIAVKRQIEMSWGLLKWATLATLLQSMSNTFFEFYYPDPMEGTYVTKTFYVGNRPCPAALSQNGEIYWKDLKVTLTEK